MFFFILSKDALTKSLFLSFDTIIVNKLDADILLIKNQSYYIQRVMFFALISE